MRRKNKTLFNIQSFIKGLFNGKIKISEVIAIFTFVLTAAVIIFNYFEYIRISTVFDYYNLNVDFFSDRFVIYKYLKYFLYFWILIGQALSFCILYKKKRFYGNNDYFRIVMIIIIIVIQSISLCSMFGLPISIVFIGWRYCALYIIMIMYNLIVAFVLSISLNATFFPKRKKRWEIFSNLGNFISKNRPFAMKKRDKRILIALVIIIIIPLLMSIMVVFYQQCITENLDNQKTFYMIGENSAIIYSTENYYLTLECEIKTDENGNNILIIYRNKQNKIPTDNQKTYIQKFNVVNVVDEIPDEVLSLEEENVS